MSSTSGVIDEKAAN